MANGVKTGWNNSDIRLECHKRGYDYRKFMEYLDSSRIRTTETDRLEGIRKEEEK